MPVSSWYFGHSLMKTELDFRDLPIYQWQSYVVIFYFLLCNCHAINCGTMISYHCIIYHSSYGFLIVTFLVFFSFWLVVIKWIPVNENGLQFAFIVLLHHDQTCLRRPLCKFDWARKTNKFTYATLIYELSNINRNFLSDYINFKALDDKFESVGRRLSHIRTHLSQERSMIIHNDLGS